MLLQLVDVDSEEVFSGTVTDLCEWLSSDEGSLINSRLKEESWCGKEDVVVLYMTDNSGKTEYCSFSTELTRQFLAQLPVAAVTRDRRSFVGGHMASPEPLSEHEPAPYEYPPGLRPHPTNVRGG